MPCSKDAQQKSSSKSVFFKINQNLQVWKLPCLTFSDFIMWRDKTVGLARACLRQPRHAAAERKWLLCNMRVVRAHSVV